MNEVYAGRALFRLFEQWACKLAPFPGKLQLAVRDEQVVHGLSCLLRDLNVLVLDVHPCRTQSRNLRNAYTSDDSTARLERDETYLRLDTGRDTLGRLVWRDNRLEAHRLRSDGRRRGVCWSYTSVCGVPTTPVGLRWEIETTMRALSGAPVRRSWYMMSGRSRRRA